MTAMPDGEQKPVVELFENIGEAAEELQGIQEGGEDGPRPVEEIESMCVACEENV